VNYFAPALRELARTLGRLWHRLRLVFARRKLARLETSLGLLGWQQVDFDSTTQQHADRLNAHEREQARLNNESAALALAMQELEEQRAARQREAAEAVAGALEQEQLPATTGEELDRELAARRKECKEVEARLPVLDRELRAAEERYRSFILPATPPPEVQEELFRLRKVILALPQERAQWQARLEEIKKLIARMEVLQPILQRARTEFAERDAALAAEIAAHRRTKLKVEKQGNALESSKADPYREIGRTLADHELAPLNQPEALAAVLAQRQAIAAQEMLVAASRAASGAEDRAALGRSWLTVAGAGACATGVVWWVVAH
jgi:hypothetical protein